MKLTRIFLSLIIILFVSICSCSDDNSPGTSNNNNNGGGNSTGGCAGGPSTVTDIDGNVYNVVSIGNQCWMKENLKTTHYKNGVQIPTGLSDAQWSNSICGAYAVYNDSVKYDSLYGKLYNWYAVADSNGLCPVGWHVPDNGEWSVLIKTLDSNADTNCTSCIQSNLVGCLMKEAGITHWAAPNICATNYCGFTALPGGTRDDVGMFYNVGLFGYWWSATNVSYCNLRHDASVIYHSSGGKADVGHSVRCVRD